MSLDVEETLSKEQASIQKWKNASFWFLKPSSTLCFLICLGSKAVMSSDGKFDSVPAKWIL